MNFFTSDLHFGNDEVLKIDSRPFKNNKVFSKCVIKVWNKQINKNDTIYIIGDFIDFHVNQKCKWEEGLKLVNKIKAAVILIIGNNEERLIKNIFDDSFDTFRNYCIKEGFKDVIKECEIEINKVKFYLTHKPINHHDKMLNLFGHSHRAMGIYKSFGFNVGCDLNHFRLFSENDIIDLLKNKEKYWDKDKNLKLI